MLPVNGGVVRGLQDKMALEGSAVTRGAGGR